MSLANSLKQTTAGLNRFRTALGQAASGANSLKSASGSTSTAVNKMKTSATSVAPAVSKAKSSSDQLSGSLGKLRTASTQGGSGLDKIKSTASNANGGLGKAHSAADKLKSTFDKLKGSAGGLTGELKNVKSQSDAVETSVGKAAKNAETGHKSMGNLGKGLKSASVAQKGLNLAMSSNPFGLVMTLLAPLIMQFVNMDKVTALLRKGLVIAMKSIGSAVSGMVHMALPLFKGLGNGLLAPMAGVATALNALFGILAGIHISIPGWVPHFGGKSFSFPSLHVPVPHLAEGGVVRARNGGTLALLGEAGENEAVLPLSKLQGMMGHGGGLRALTSAVEQLAGRPVVIQVDGQEIARAVTLGQRQLARR